MPGWSRALSTALFGFRHLQDEKRYETQPCPCPGVTSTAPIPSESFHPFLEHNCNANSIFSRVEIQLSHLDWACVALAAPPPLPASCLPVARSAATQRTIVQVPLFRHKKLAKSARAWKWRHWRAHPGCQLAASPMTVLFVSAEASFPWMSHERKGII